MADRLEQYLENLGISTDEDDAPTPPDEALTHPPQDAAPAVQGDVMQGVVEGDAVARCESFLVHLLLNLDPAYAVEVREAEGELSAEIYGGESGRIIGRGGRTLAALEYLTNAVINRSEDTQIRVSIDIGGYKTRRDERLRTVATRAAARVRKTGFAVELEPMSAAERRVIHMTLADDPYVMSESSGDGRNRRVVVKPT